jgi:hypothetical protein
LKSTGRIAILPSSAIAERVMTATPSRRQVVVAIAATASLIGWSRFGAAFQTVPLDAGGAAAIAAACGGAPDDHGRLVEAARRANAERPEAARLSIDRLRDVLRRASCPICGCAILAADADLPAD